MAAAAAVLIVVGTIAVVAGQRDRSGVEVGPTDGGPGTTAAAGPLGPNHLDFDHWHEAYGLYVCDNFLAPYVDAKEDVSGIHTHGDGVVHIHPFGPESSGTNATFGLFGDQIGVDVSADGWTLPDGTAYRTGSATCGSPPADVVVYRWSVDDGRQDPVAVDTQDFDRIVFDADRQAYTIAVVPQGTVPPRPPTIEMLDNLTDIPSPTDPPIEVVPG